jgi:hypothetical protein
VTANELLDLLEMIPDEDKKRSVMIEVETDVFVNFRRIRYDQYPFLILSGRPDSFDEALEKAVVD